MLFRTIECAGHPPPLFGSLLLVLAAFLPLKRAAAAGLASDNAADPAYNNGWTSGSNGGAGWGGPWQIFVRTNSTTFIGSSATNGADADNDNDINTPRTPGGRAWGMRVTGPGDGDVSAARQFDGALSPGQTFNADIDTGLLGGTGIGENGDRQRLILASGTATGSNSFSFILNAASLQEGNPKDYTYVDATANFADTGVPITHDGLHFAFTLLDSTGDYSAVLTPLPVGSKSTTITGHVHQSAPTLIIEYVSSVGNAVGVTGFAGSHYLNDIAIVPQYHLSGDANGDGIVNFADFLALAQNYGKAGTLTDGDFNNDGSVGFDDLIILARNYGRTELTGTVAAVPEPVALGLPPITALLLRRRRGSRNGNI